jgi:hypothetical protein
LNARLLVAAAAAAGALAVTHVPGPALASALAGLCALSILGAGALAGGSRRAWPSAVGTMAAVGSLALPAPEAPLLPLPSWILAVTALAFLHVLHGARRDGPSPTPPLGARLLRSSLTALVLALPVLAAARPSLLPTALAASREAALGGAAILVGLAVLGAGAFVHLLRVASTRTRPTPEGSP